ncbi:hypothetical protein NQD34_003721 [Periophthalmus magnuspinnatus]|uniref:uncharacterized protein LOC129456237 n=1 Tax=Periophthalmus magnuspinnatus TaxID=409849 RepID=UPI0022CB33EC|nr:uncharacterized protein LOC129456237 [Periophthalmus magnuspinnatus]KAJ0023822.1 hypothetical protein NQD34_003721 [Periophthalmus magnuspinnatus]
MADALVLVQLKANRNTAKRQFSRLANNVQRMYTVMSEEELKDSFKTLTIEANKVFEANDDVEDQYAAESQLEGGTLTEEQRADLEKTKSECENRLDELKGIILTTLWAKYGEEELKMVVETAESEAVRVGAIEPNEDEEGYDFMVKHLGMLVGRAKTLHTQWKSWAPSTDQKDLQSRVSDLERALLKVTARKVQFIQVRVKDRLNPTTFDFSATPAIKLNTSLLPKFLGSKCDFYHWKKDWEEQQEQGAREVKKHQLLNSIDDRTVRDLRLSTCTSANDIFRVLHNHFGNKTCVNEETSKPRHDSTQNGTTVSSSLSPGCVICGDNKHSKRLYFCKRFQGLKISEKKDAVRKLGACIKCLDIHSEHDNCKEEFFCNRTECSKSKEHHFLLCPRPVPKTRVSAVGGDSNKSYTEAQKEFVKKLPSGRAKENNHVFSNSMTKTSNATSNQSAGEWFGGVSRENDAARGNGQRWVKDWQAHRPGARYKSYNSQSSQKPQPQK